MASPPSSSTSSSSTAIVPHGPPAPASSSQAGASTAYISGNIGRSDPIIRNCERPEIVSTSTKAWIIFALFLSAILITTTVLAMHGHFPSVPSWGVKIIKGVTFTVCGGQITCIPLFIHSYWQESKHIKTLTACVSLRNNQLAIEHEKTQAAAAATGSTSSQSTKKVKDKELTPTDWDNRLANTKPEETYFDLIDPKGKSQKAAPKLPSIARAKGNSLDPRTKSTQLMAARLPRSQIGNFNLELQESFNNQKVEKENIECYFLVVLNQRTDPKLTKHHFSLHEMVINENTTDQKTNCKMSLFGADGVEEIPDAKNKERLPFGRYRNSEVKIERSGAYSSENGGFRINKDADVSSFCVGAIFGHRAVAIHTIVVNTDENGKIGEEGEKILAATKEKSISEFLNRLKNSKSKSYGSVDTLFTHPENSTKQKPSYTVEELD